MGPASLHGCVTAPPSKSYTHRELVASYFADGRSELVRPLRSSDTSATRRGLTRLGARVWSAGDSWFVEPPSLVASGRRRRTSIDCGESGTSLRFLTAVAATRSYPVRLFGGPRLSRRPIGGLLRFLEAAGAEVRRPRKPRTLPITVLGPVHALRGALDASESSQYLSALLLAFPSIAGVTRISAVGAEVSAPYVAATRDVLARRGVEWDVSGRESRIQGPRPPRARRVTIPGDASSAAYLWAGAAATGGEVRVTGVPRRRPQADLAILGILKRMGARVELHPDGATVRGKGLKGVAWELTDQPDLLPLVGALAALARGSTRILGAAHAAFKESDRRKTTASLVRAIGGRVRLLPRRIDITPGAGVRPLLLPSIRDHRVIMSAAIAALGASGPSTLGDARAVEKSFPGFWSELRALGGSATPVRP
ncbi:MAG TPA: 3-phosphoshikimate 1-carboxyvinyltransferase [Thermoplasmata archaeon]|nr:3-phosphoshikimate 1-carboxyvinyltransferase [Thermoplasmata archaeon]